MFAVTVMACTSVTEIPRPMAVEIFLETARKVHIPKKKARAMFSTKMARTAREMSPSILVGLDRLDPVLALFHLLRLPGAEDPDDDADHEEG